MRLFPTPAYAPARVTATRPIDIPRQIESLRAAQEWFSAMLLHDTKYGRHNPLMARELDWASQRIELMRRRQAGI